MLRVAPRTHTLVLATLSTIAAIATAIVPPFAGALSDRARRNGGDRRLQTAVILALDALALVAMAGRARPSVALAGTVVVATVRDERAVDDLSGAGARDRPAPRLGDGGRLSRCDDAGRNDRRASPRRAAARPPALLVDAAGVALSAVTLFFVPRLAAGGPARARARSSATGGTCSSR